MSTRKQDGGLRSLVHKNLAPRGTECWAMETGSTVSGVPDTYWLSVADGLDGWIEHKVADNWQVSVRPHQVGKLMRLVAAGKRAHILVRARGAGSGGTSRDALWVLSGGLASDLATGGLRAVSGREIARWEGPPTSWPWAELVEILRR